MRKHKRLPDLTSRQLRAVIAVARYSNFLAAAAELRTSQSALSRTIQQVERLLEVTLFSRSTRQVSLTAAGREFVPAAERILHDLGLTVWNVREVANAHRGRLHVASLMSVAHGVLPRVVEIFWKDFANFDLQISQRVQLNVLEDVRAGAVDLGIANRIPADDALCCETLGEERYYVLMTPDHPLAGMSGVSIRDLASERMISVTPSANLRLMLDALASGNGCTLNHKIVLDHISAVEQFVARGLGVTVVPSSMLPPSDPEKLTFRPLREMQSGTELAVFYPRGRELSSAAHRFKEILKEHFATRTADPQVPKPCSKRPSASVGRRRQRHAPLDS